MNADIENRPRSNGLSKTANGLFYKKMAKEEDLTGSWNYRDEPSTRCHSRAFTISMPPKMAKAARTMAKRQNRTISESMREAFRVYEKDEVSRPIDETAAYAAMRNPNGHTEDDIPRPIKDDSRRNACAARRRSCPEIKIYSRWEYTKKFGS